MSTNRESRKPAAKQESQESAPTSRRVSALAHEAIDSATGRAEEVERKLRSEAQRIAEKSHETTTGAKDHLDETLTRVEDFIRQRPIAAAGIAFAAGALGALLMKR